MAYKIRPATKKPLVKPPGEVIGRVNRIGDFIREYASQLWAAAGVILALGLVIGGYWVYQVYQERRAENIQFEALRLYRQESQAASGKPLPLDEDHLRKAAELFQDVISDFPRTSSARLARYYLGNIHLELKDYPSAISAYQDFLDHAGDHSLLKGLAYQRIGYAYDLGGQKDKALSAFESVNRIPGAVNQDVALYEMGRLQESLGKGTEATRNYQEILMRHPGSMYLAEAQARLKGLGVSEVKPEPGASSSGSSAVGSDSETPREGVPGAKGSEGEKDQEGKK